MTGHKAEDEVTFASFTVKLSQFNRMEFVVAADFPVIRGGHCED